jgi:Na+/H+ antiporter NhaC
MADHDSQNSKMNNNYLLLLLLLFIIVFVCFLFKMPIWRELLMASLTKFTGPF